MNPMRELKVEKVVINIGVGPDKERLEKAKVLLERITGRKPLVTKARVREEKWGIRRGFPIGLKVTLRKKVAVEFLKKALYAVDYVLSEENFDQQGNFAFGVKEYIDLPGVKYDPDIGMFGFDVIVRVSRPGLRVKYRRIKRSKIGKMHLATKEDGIEFAKAKFGVRIRGKDEE